MLDVCAVIDHRSEVTSEHLDLSETVFLGGDVHIRFVVLVHIPEHIDVLDAAGEVAEELAVLVVLAFGF